MPKTINPVRKAGVKRDLMRGITAKQALKNNGYSDAVAHKSTVNRVVKVCQAEIAEELKELEITAESIKMELDTISSLAIANKDFSTATRCTELKGKMKALFKDHQITEDLDKPFDFGRFREIHKGRVESSRVGGGD